MKKILLTAGICLTTLIGAKAQTATTRIPSGEEQKTSQELSNIISACNLTPAQAAKAKPIVTEAVQSKEANARQYGSDKSKLNAANETTTKTEVAKLNGILSADQKVKLNAYEQQAAAKMQTKVSTSK